VVPTDEPPQGSSENTLDASVPAAPDGNPQVPHDSEPDADGDQVDGGSRIISAILLGISIVMASIIVTTGMDRSGSLIAASIRQTELALGAALRAAAPPAPKPAPSAEFTTKYTLNTVGSPSEGPASAKVTLVEFSDFQCPYCARVTPTLRKIRANYGDDVRIVFKHLPLPIHPKAMDAHYASEAAHRQGKFWPFHNKIFVEQASMSEAKYREWAEELGLDMRQFSSDLASAETKAKVDSDLQEARELGLRSTPSFFINGYLLKGAKPYSVFKERIDQELAKSR